jgi:hypothetical protein
LPEDLQPSQDNPLPQVRESDRELLKGEKEAGTDRISDSYQKEGERVWKKMRYKKTWKARIRSSVEKEA